MRSKLPRSQQRVQRGAALYVSLIPPLFKLPCDLRRMRAVSSTPVCQLCGHPTAATYDSKQSEAGSDCQLLRGVLSYLPGVLIVCLSAVFVIIVATFDFSNVVVSDSQLKPRPDAATFGKGRRG